MNKTTHISPLSHRKPDARAERRRMAAKLFQKGYTQAEAARQCGVSREAAREWYGIWKRKGINGLETVKKPGSKPRLTEAKRKRVESALLKGPRAFGYQTDLWTLERVAHVIKKTARVQYHQRHVWRVLLSLGWSCQKPEKRARERNEKAIEDWKHSVWPRIKKNRKTWAPAGFP